MSGFLSGRTSLTTVQTADIADNAIGLAQLAHQTDGSILTFGTDTAPTLLAPDTSGEVLTTKGAGALPAFDAVSTGFTLATEQATTSGTSFTFGSIPAGVTQIDVMFHEVSLDATTGPYSILVQIGDSGGIETSGYISSCGSNDAAYLYSRAVTSGFNIFTINYVTAAALLISGTMSLYLEDAANESWVMSGTYKQSSTNEECIAMGGGSKTLSAELTQLKILHESSANFDAGAINIKYM